MGQDSRVVERRTLTVLAKAGLIFLTGHLLFVALALLLAA
jgi:hypothetical protein